jgi:hypothetical protein
VTGVYLLGPRNGVGKVSEFSHSDSMLTTESTRGMVVIVLKMMQKPQLPFAIPLSSENSQIKSKIYNEVRLDTRSLSLSPDRHVTCG